MRELVLLAAALPAWLCFSQETAPIGIDRGNLIAWSGTAGAGEIVFRTAENRLFRCSFDQRTYFERANQRIKITAANKSDPIEVLADRKIGTGVCYVRTVQFLDSLAVRRARLKIVPSVRFADLFEPRGNITFAGVVVKISPEEMTVRSRSNERRTVLLRPDTRFLGEGEPLNRDNLPLNTRVFVRAGKNLDGDVEAYQVIWGGILEPVIAPER